MDGADSKPMVALVESYASGRLAMAREIREMVESYLNTWLSEYNASGNPYDDGISDGAAILADEIDAIIKREEER